MARPRRKTSTASTQMDSGEVTANDTPVVAVDDTMENVMENEENAPAPEPVVVEIVQHEAPQHEISERTRLEMEEGRRMLEKFR